MTLPQKLSTFRSSFQFKLLLRFTLFAAAITALCVTLFVIYQIREDKRHVSEQLRLEARSLASSIRLPLYAENLELLEWYAQETLRLPEIRCVEIVGGNGKVRLRVPLLPPASGEELIVEGAQVRTLPPHLSPEPSLQGADDLIGEVRLYRSTEDLWRAGRRLAWFSCVLALGCWLLVSFSCYLLLRRVTASFNSLMRGLENVHDGDYVSRIAVTSDDEPGRASASVNELAESLRQREEENRRLHRELLASMDFEIASKRQLVSINTDLEREIAERTLAQQELKNLVEQLPLGIIWSDHDGAIEYLNAFIAERIGHQDARHVDEWLSRVCPDAGYRDRVAAERRAAIESWERDNLVTFYEVKALCSDGSQRHLNCSNQRSGSRTVDIIIDLTDRELLQQQIVRNQKLESIGVLAGGIAHNFNNALTGVLGYISFAKKYLDQSHSAHPLLLHAEKATLRAAGFANQLLSFAKGGTPLRKAVPVAALVEESVQLAISGTSVTATVELPPDLPPVYVDDRQMRQAFNCICINAVQAMAEGGTLTVSGRSVASAHEVLPAPLCGSYVELSFRDQGCGIREEDRSNIFTPYFTTKAELGTGLGLATVHSILARHDGAITFDTALGEGTTFTLYLPVFRAQAPASSSATAPASSSAKAPAAGAVAARAVLVMDDDEMIRNLAVQVLCSQGYRVTVCASGEEAAALYGEAYRCGAPYLAAILDLTVSHGSGGREAARQILALDPGARLILSSGYSDDEAMHRYRDYGFCATSPKPYDAERLFRLLQELAEREEPAG